MSSQIAVQVLVADPPWAPKDQLPGPRRGASKHYSTLTAAEIERFPLPALADDALLFLWRLASMPEEALNVARAWGFTPKTELVWLKKTASGKRHFGMGHYLRAEHETCLVATRGRATKLIRSHAIRSVFEGEVREHSAKPEAFYAVVEELVVPSAVKFELFARRQRPGWVQRGNELGALQ